MNFITPEPVFLFLFFPFILGGIWIVLHKIIPQFPNWIVGLIISILSLAYILIIANVNETTLASISAMNTISQSQSDIYLELYMANAGKEVCSSSVYYWNLLYVALLFMIAIGVKTDKQEENA